MSEEFEFDLRKTNIHQQVTEAELALVKRLRDDFPFFCRNCIKVYDKEGKLVEFVFNRAQEYLWSVIWGMWCELGYIRVIGVKGRQQGFSLLIQAFFLWWAIFHSGTRVSVIAHKQDSTAALFEKTQTMLKYMSPDIRPGQLKANEKQHKFDNDSQYTLNTAGSGEAGRGDNATHQHRSEEAFFENPGEVKAGIGRIVSTLIGTVIIRESTGNGQNGFYVDAMKASKGKGLYRLAFVPWHWSQEYRRKPDPGFERTEEEQRFVELYGLDDWQLQWRRDTIDELDEKGYPGEKRFKQEYPFTLLEAFQSSEESFFDPALVQKAQLSKLNEDPELPLVMGVDIGRHRDRSVIALRRGRVFRKFHIKNPKNGVLNSIQQAKWIRDIAEQFGVDRIFIDYGNHGAGVYDQLCALGLAKITTPVDFGSGASSKRFANKRTEMIWDMGKWLADGEVSLPDDDDMVTDLAAIPQFKENANGVISFPSKDEIKKNLKRSTDIVDAMILTFAYPVKSSLATQDREERQARRAQKTRSSSLSARRHVESLGDDTERISPRRRDRYGLGSGNWGRYRAIVSRCLSFAGKVAS